MSASVKTEGSSIVDPEVTGITIFSGKAESSEKSDVPEYLKGVSEQPSITTFIFELPNEISDSGKFVFEYAPNPSEESLILLHVIPFDPIEASKCSSERFLERVVAAAAPSLNIGNFVSHTDPVPVAAGVGVGVGPANALRPLRKAKINKFFLKINFIVILTLEY
jgi:hypothetical protein